MRRLLRRAALLAFHAAFVRPVVRWFVGVRYRRKGFVPEGPCLVVSNHNSHLDAAVLMTLFPMRRLPHAHPVAAADYFGKTWFRRTVAMMLMNGIPIERTPRAGEDPLQPMIAALESGEALIFFPEGSRGEPGVVAPFRSGVGRLVQAVPGLLIVPVFLSGPERVWPRGQAVPLPLGIDANVGKPRTYASDGEAREIAESVRRDVLALAPPPPPVPGPRPRPPIRAAVCGIEPEPRDALLVATARRLGAHGFTVGLSDPAVEADEGGVREAGGGIPVARSRAWIGLLARIFRTGGLYRGYRFAEMVEKARMDEALEDGRTARFVAGGGSALVDLLAWAEADLYRGVFDERELLRVLHYLSGERRIPFLQWWRFVRKAPEVWLLNAFDLAHLKVPGICVLLRSSPAAALERARTRGRTLEAHETRVFLAMLQEGYGRVAALLRRRGVEVLEYDAADLDAEAVSAEVAAHCLRLDAAAGAPAAGTT